MKEQLKRVVCLLLHWQRQRDSYGNQCQKCSLYW